MDHIHFVTELDLAPAEQRTILKAHMLRVAIDNCKTSNRSVAMELVRTERMMSDRSVLHLIPVDDAAIMQRRLAQLAPPKQRKTS